MVKVPVYDAQGKQVRTAEFDESIFGDKVLARTLKEVVLAYGRNKRQGTNATKDRGDVSGSNRKLWKQKGTGRARVGDRRPPHWRGGGSAHGPHPRDYARRIPTRLREAALNSALLAKFRKGEVSVVEGLEVKEGPKTSKVAAFLKGRAAKGKTLFTLSLYDPNFYKSTRNIQSAAVRELRELNAYDVCRFANLVLIDGAFEALRNGVAAKTTSGAKGAAKE